ncbi:hypothetical protein BH24ACT7_BH24ACT7_25260 [soil metagenome]
MGYLSRHWPTIVVALDRRYRSQAQPSGLIEALLGAGHDPSVVDPATCTHNLSDAGWLGGADLVVARGRTHAVLCVLAWAERLGIPTINRRAAVVAVQDKAAMGLALAGHGIPIPPTYLGAPRLLALDIPPAHYPLILKPVMGDNGRGLRLVHDPGELSRLPWSEPMALAQPYLPGDGFDLKLYGIGDQVWAVRKPAPRLEGLHPADRGVASAGPVPVSDELRRLALGCAGVFGLELYGVDCLPTSTGHVVIEVNDFPNYTGVPGADQHLADHLARRARERRAA